MNQMSGSVASSFHFSGGAGYLVNFSKHVLGFVFHFVAYVVERYRFMMQFYLEYIFNIKLKSFEKMHTHSYTCIFRDLM